MFVKALAPELQKHNYKKRKADRSQHFLIEPKENGGGKGINDHARVEKPVAKPLNET